MADPTALSTPDPLVDPTGKARPALSASSQNPDVPRQARDQSVAPPLSEGPKLEQPKTLDIAKPAEETPLAEPQATKPEDGEDKPTGEAVADDTGKKVAWDDLPLYVRRELTKARNRARSNAEQSAQERAQREAAEARAARLEADLREAREANEPVPLPQPKPVRESFDTMEAFTEALLKWGRDEGQREALAESRKQRQEAARTAAERTAQAKAAGFNARLQEFGQRGGEKYEDFAAVVGANGLPITETMAEALFEEENGVEVAYELARDPKEVARIAALPAARQIREIGRLADKLANPPPPKLKREDITAAPAPVQPVRSSAAALPRGPEQMGGDEYYEARTREMYPQAKAEAMIAAARRYGGTMH